jgi:hypothetical protein
VVLRNCRRRPGQGRLRARTPERGSLHDRRDRAAVPKGPEGSPRLHASALSENHEKVFFSIAHVDSPGTDFTEITITHALMLVGSTFTEWDMSDEEIEQTWID